MADTKFLDYSGLQYFYNKLLTKFPEGTDFSNDFTITRDENTGDITSISLRLGNSLTETPVDPQDPSGPQKIEVNTGALFTKMFETYTVPAGKTDTDNAGKQILRVNPTYLQFEYVDSNSTELRLNVKADGIGAALAQEAGDGTSQTPGNIYYNTTTHKLSYILPPASASVRGGVRVGDGLTITDTDKLGVSVDGTTIEINNSTKQIKVKDNTYAPLENQGTELNPEYKVPSQYLPSYVDEVTEGYYVPSGETILVINPDTGNPTEVTLTSNKFYKNRTGEGTAQSPYIYSNELPGLTDKIYIDLATNNTYRYGGSTFVEISSGAIDIITNNDIDTIMNGSSNNEEEEPQP